MDVLGQRHARVTVMGLGLFGGGVGAARFWSRLGSAVTVTDLRSAEELQPSLAALSGCDVELVLGEHREEDFANTDVVVVNPAVKPDNHYLCLAREHGAAITTEIATVMRMVHGPTYAITGSNGKSTTTALLGHMLCKHDSHTLVGGNIGGSLLDNIEKYFPSAPVVLELSSFQLYYLGAEKLSPHVAIVTNLAPNHLDWHRDLDDYYESKRNILRHQFADDVAVLGAEDPVLREWAEDCEARVGLFGLDDPDYPNAAFVRDDIAVVRVAGRGEEVFDRKDLKLPGNHNLRNALAAVLAARMESAVKLDIAASLPEFTGLPHRLELVREVGGVRFYNDSIATTPESVMAALDAFDCPRIIIAGGYDKGVSFAELGKAISRQAESVVLLGKTAKAIATAIENSGGSKKINFADTLTEAVEKSFKICPSGGVVLLSPACASYDMFKNFQDRGEQFRDIVNNL